MRASIVGAVVVCAFPLAAVADAAPTLEFFPPTIYDADTSAMNQALGLVGGAAEDFEDGMLIPGLSVTLVGYLGGYDLYPYHENVAAETPNRPGTYGRTITRQRTAASSIAGIIVDVLARSISGPHPFSAG